MSEELSSGMPEPTLPEPGPGPATARFTRPRLALIASVSLLAAGGLVAGVLVATSGSVPPPRYASLPANCALLTAATLATYLPGATGSPENVHSSADEETACSWQTFGGRRYRALFVSVSMFRSRSGVPRAEQAFLRLLTGSAPAGFKVTTQSVTGLGDQATEKVISRTYADGTETGRGLAVRSSNAEIYVSYSVRSIGRAQSGGNTASLADEIAVARDVLAVLADPATAATPAPAVPVAGPRYTVPPHGCRLVAAATLARYLPGATVAAGTTDTPSGSGPGPRQSSCTWSDANLDSLTVTVDKYASATGFNSAQASFEYDVQSYGQSGNGTTVNGTQPVSGLGDEATAIFQIDQLSQGVFLIVWSGNTEIQVTYDSSTIIYGDGAPAVRAAQLRAATAIGHDVLAALPRS